MLLLGPTHHFRQPAVTRSVQRVVLQCGLIAVFGCFFARFAALADPPSWEDSLHSILSIDANLDGQTQHADNWQVLANATTPQVFELFRALDDAGPVAANWIRPAIDAAMDRLNSRGENLPSSELEQFIRDTQHGRRARELALRELGKSYPQKKKKLEDEMLNDPVAIFRQPAIERLLARAEIGDISADDKKALLLQAWEASREEDQAIAIAKQLKQLDAVVDPLEHFGWLTRWFVAGPFEDENDHAYETSFAPEQEEIPAAMFHGDAWRNKSYAQGDKQVSWQAHEITAANGELDFNEVLGRLKGIAAYAVALIDSDVERNVELRMRQQNSFKLWLNGELVLAQPIGNTGNSFDQYTFPIHLNAGTNVLVVKSSQIHPPMAHPFFETWHTSARICDSTGGAVQGVSQPELPKVDES